MKKFLSADGVKYIAIFTMVLDHVAWFFIPFESPVSQVFHFLGRLTAPVMCYFIAEGYTYTKSVKKYALRLFIFGLLSQFPWWSLHNNHFTLSFSMMFTLLLCLMAVYVCDKVENKALCVILIIGIVFLSTYCDWPIYAVLWTLCFYLFREDNLKKYLSFGAVALWYFAETLLGSVSTYGSLAEALPYTVYALGSFLSIPLLLIYNGKKGKYKWSKWVFYWFYPVHLFIIAVVKGFM